MNLNFFASRSLKTRVTLLTVGFFLLGIWGLALYASSMLRHDFERMLGQQQLSATGMLADEINNELNNRFSAMARVAERITPAMLAQPTALQTLLEQQVILPGLFNGGVFILKVDGTAVAEVPTREHFGQNFLSRDDVVSALHSGKTGVGKPLLSRAKNEPEFGMTVPIHDAQGWVIGALRGDIHLNLPSFLNTVTDHKYGSSGSFLLVSKEHRRVVVNSGGTRVLDPAPPAGANAQIDRFMQGFEGPAVFIDPFGVEILASAKAIAASDWYLAATLPTAEAFAPIAAMQKRLLLAALALTLLIGVLLWWLLRRELAPLFSTALRLAAIPLSPQFPNPLPIIRDDEVGRLIGGFNHLLSHLQQREAVLKQILDSSDVAIFVVNEQGEIIQANQSMARMFGCPLDALVGCDYVSLLDPLQLEAGRDGMQAVLRNEVDSSEIDRLYRRYDESEFWGHLACRGLHDAGNDQHSFVGVIADISERMQNEKFEQFRSRILEQLANGESLQSLLEAIAHGVEELNPGAFSSILLLSSDGAQFDRVVAPTLPDFYTAALDGQAVASCGAAAFGKERGIVSDMAADAEPTPFTELALRCGLAACWMQPVFSTLGQVLGMMATYHQKTYTPPVLELTLVERFGRLVSIVVERHSAAQRIRDSEERFRSLIEESPAAISVHRERHLLYLNPAAFRLFGADTAQQLIGKDLLELTHPDFHQMAQERFKTVIDTGNAAPLIDQKYLKLDGTVIDVEVQSSAMLYEGQPAIRTAFRDITERKIAGDKLQLSASVFTHAREGIAITDANANLIDVNEAFCRITGYRPDEVLGRNPRLLASGRQGQEFYTAMWRELLDKGHWYGEIWNQRKNGDIYPEMLTISAVRNEQGQTSHYVALFSDISVIKRHQSELEHIAHFDALTNLPNRVLLSDRLRQGMVGAQRRRQKVAVVYLDLDGFKAINDRHGHEAGDLLLMTVANRMKHMLREGDTLARVGGDEFVAVLVDLDDNLTSVPLLKRLLAAAAEPVQHGGQWLQVSVSLGVSFYPQTDEVEADQLLRQADQAMYQAKLAGKNRYYFFDAELDRNVRDQHESVEHIRLALLNQEFVLYYQPKVNMRSGAVIGVEALIRWQHPQQGLLAPAKFLPPIEDHPLAVDVGEWVIATALNQVELWQADGLDIAVSVNVGARQLQQAGFVQRLRELLAAHPGLNPSRLEIEVLETSALEDLAGVSQVIEECREIGVLFSMDDFGTGYSSLTYLKRLQVNQLKIDQSFVCDMLNDPDDLAILEGVIGLAAAFRRDVIAEGVETIAHGTMLLQMGCDLAQGYGIARPMPAGEMPNWAATWQRDAAWIGIEAGGPVSR